MPADKLGSREAVNFAEGDHKLNAARGRRRVDREIARASV
jgi:hypothetical protein